MQNDNDDEIKTEDVNADVVGSGAQASDDNQNSDYDFLNDDKKSANQNGSTGSTGVMDKFDEAFNKSSKEIQDYILSDEFPENIALICKLQKLDDPKENVIIENVAVSILVGLLSTHDAKNTLIESFKASGILIEDLAAQMLLKDIDSYILSQVRKQILQSKIANKEIRHLTLKEDRLEKEKDELRKILLANTGNLNGRGGVFQYEKKEYFVEKKEEAKEAAESAGAISVTTGHDRESLLAKININPGELSDTDKLKERMRNIRIEEEERLDRLENEKAEEAKERLGRESLQKEIEEERMIEKKEKNLDENDLSLYMKENLERKIESGGKESFDLENVIKEREAAENLKEHLEEQKIADENDAKEASVDPYRESI